MKITLTQGYVKNGETIKEVEMKENFTIGMEEQALDMCIVMGKQNNIFTAEFCSIAVATGLKYDDVRNLCPSDYELLRKEYYRFFYKTPEPTEPAAEPKNLMPEQV